MAFGIGSEGMKAEDEAEKAFFIRLLRKKHLRKALAEESAAYASSENAEQNSSSFQEEDALEE
jgi:hypothetical protein